MHPRNLHHQRYDLNALVISNPALRDFIVQNPSGQETIDFTNPTAVKVLNQALLKKYYGINYWDIPPQFLVPPVPGRSDYIHYLADLVGERKSCRGLDIGTGANLIYPLLGHALYRWSFVGSDVNPEAIKSAENIIQKNHLAEKIELRLQPGPGILRNLIRPDEKFDFSMCNPPFHSSANEARQGSARKWKNLGRKNSGLNFGGDSRELWCEGGELLFIKRMIDESSEFKENCRWFTTLVSKESNLPTLQSSLRKAGTAKIEVIQMSQGQKKSRILAWSFRIPDH
jgi:23S rRNA (adenine1618-N6)-methyltransferase